MQICRLLNKCIIAVGRSIKDKFLPNKSLNMDQCHLTLNYKQLYL